MEERNIYVQINQRSCKSTGIHKILTVKQFKYLGSVVQENCSSDIEIEKVWLTKKIMKMLNSVLWNINILLSTKVLIRNQ
jgi:hypothetical protein